MAAACWQYREREPPWKKRAPSLQNRGRHSLGWILLSKRYRSGLVERIKVSEWHVHAEQKTVKLPVAITTVLVALVAVIK